MRLVDVSRGAELMGCGKSGGKPHAVQTLRDIVSGTVFAKRLECCELAPAFSSEGGRVRMVDVSRGAELMGCGESGGKPLILTRKNQC